MNPHRIGLGMLSWKAHETLRGTLETYRAEGFFDLFEDKVIYFSDISDEDREIAEHYGCRAVGGRNQGIAVGSENLAKVIESEHILIVQNDNPLVESCEFAHKHLGQALELLNSGQADLVRMRHRWQVGEGFMDIPKYLRYYPLSELHPSFCASQYLPDEALQADSVAKKLRRILRAGRAHQMKGRSVFVEKYPEILHPQVIKRYAEFLIVDSSALNFSDQCFMTSKKFFLDELMTYVNANPSTRTLNGFQVPEICLNSPWWRSQHFKIAQGRGLFSHGRHDGSFRPGHHAYRQD